MTTNDEIRLDSIEKRLDKYDEIIGELRDIVVELKTRADSNFKWMTTLIGVSGITIGGFIGHFIH